MAGRPDCFNHGRSSKVSCFGPLQEGARPTGEVGASARPPLARKNFFTRATPDERFPQGHCFPQPPSASGTGPPPRK